MARFWPIRRRDQSQLPPPVTQFNQPARRRWPVIAASVIAALVLVGLAVLAGLLIYNAVHKSPSKKPNVANNNQNQQQQAPSGTTGPSRSGSNQPSGSRATGGTGAGTQRTPAGGASTAGGQVGKTLPNNGPGDVIALFAGSSLVAAGLHYIIRLRRAN